LRLRYLSFAGRDTRVNSHAAFREKGIATALRCPSKIRLPIPYGRE
jgi:hypothetical protein